MILKQYQRNALDVIGAYFSALDVKSRLDRLFGTAKDVR